MYFLTPMCFICFKSKNDLNIMNMEMLTKLLYCTGKGEEFLSSALNQMKICQDCLSKLNTAFHFKKMCLDSIVQFKDYVDQLELTSGNYNSFNVIKVEMIDISDQNIKKEPEDVYFEPHSFEQVIKNEIEDNVCGGSNEFQEQELLTCKEEVLDYVYEEDIKNQSEEYNDLHVKNPSEMDDIKEHPKTKLLFSCSVCDKLYHSEKYLLQHMLTHVDEKIFPCPKCKSFFTNETSLVEHVHIHIETAEYFCSMCGKSFMCGSALNKHRLTHKDGKHCCSTCGSCFKSKAQLNQHTLKLKHSNKRPHSPV